MHKEPIVALVHKEPIGFIVASEKCGGKSLVTHPLIPLSYLTTF